MNYLHQLLKNSYHTHKKNLLPKKLFYLTLIWGKIIDMDDSMTAATITAML